MLREVRDVLSNNNYTLTQQRINIINFMINQSRHLTIKDICDAMESPYASQATIYRNLKLFDELGLCNKALIKGETYYELKFSDEKKHYHFRCEKCHRIIEIPASRFNDQMKELSNALGVTINDSQISLSGLCNQCKGS